MTNTSSVNDLSVYAAASDFNPGRLTLAREAQGLTQKELSERVDATASAISQFESGATNPSPEMVGRLALALGYPPQFFALALPDRLRLDACHFRKLRGTSRREQRRVLARGDLLLAVVEQLEEHVRFPGEQISQHRTQVNGMADIEELTERLREVWSLGWGPVSDMMALLENLGVLVLELAGHTQDLDAFSTWLEDRPLVFLSTDKNSASRRRFDCAHELGHLLMHAEAEAGSRALEDQANRFASSFLLPARSFGKEYPQRLSWGHLRALKRRWRVSLAALIKRAYDLDLITEATYRRAFVRLSQSGWRDVEPDEPAMERATLLVKAVRTLAEAGQKRIAQLAEAIALRQATVEDLLSGTSSQPALSLSLS